MNHQYAPLASIIYITKWFYKGMDESPSIIVMTVIIDGNCSVFEEQWVEAKNIHLVDPLPNPASLHKIPSHILT